MTVYGKKISDETMEAIAIYMDDEIRERLNFEMAPCSNEEFINAYLDQDPDFEKLLESEFSFDRTGTPEKKYCLDFVKEYGESYIALEEVEGGNAKCILTIECDSIPGLRELEQADKIGEGYELINSYIKEKLGFLPDYEVGYVVD